MATEVKVPVLPESVSDATIASWHKKAGDAVKRDENLVDLETDKVVLEVPAPVDGVLKEIRFKEGDTVTSQQLLAIIEEGAVAAAPAPVAAPAAGAQEVQPRAAAAKAEAAAPASTRPAPVAAAELPPGLGDLSRLVQNLRPVETAPAGEHDLAVLMYDAHETLARVDPQNLQRFKDVLAFLREDLKRF